MKTLTFEELVGVCAYSHDCSSFIEIVTKKECIELMKQVRLATLEECADKVTTNDSCKVWNCEGESINKHSILDLDKNSIEIN